MRQILCVCSLALAIGSSALAQTSANAKILKLNELLKMARADIAVGNFDGAVKAMTEATAAKPDEPILWDTLGDAQLGMANAAAKAAQDPKTTDPTVYDKYAAAVTSYTKALSLNSASSKPNSELAAARTHLHKAQALYSVGRTDEAFDELRVLVKDFANSPEASQARMLLHDPSGLAVPRDRLRQVPPESAWRPSPTEDNKSATWAQTVDFIRNTTQVYGSSITVEATGECGLRVSTGATSYDVQMSHIDPLSIVVDQTTLTIVFSGTSNQSYRRCSPSSVASCSDEVALKKPMSFAMGDVENARRVARALMHATLICGGNKAVSPF